MHDLNQPSRLDVQFTDDQLATYIDWVEAAGENREQQGFDSASFCAGAMVVLFAMGMQQRTPAAWILGPLMGGKVFGARRDAGAGAAGEAAASTDTTGDDNGDQ